jgi:c-di-GMP-specific phosphodiesterase
MRQGRQFWDATAVFEALASADVVLWNWEPGRDRLRITGAARNLGLGPLAPECAAAAAYALAMPQDRAIFEEFLRPQEPGAEISARIQMRGGETCVWRGVWLEEGGIRAAGVIAPESKFAASEIDGLTGLLDRRSFLVRARERLVQPLEYELVVADLNRLRRLNEALGHERADLVLAALGSRLAAGFPAGVVMGRIGEDEYALLSEPGRQNLTDDLRRVMEQPLRIAGFDIHPTLAIGSVSCKGGPDTIDAGELLRRAEVALEAAKAAGRGSASTYGEGVESDGLSRLALESDLRGAIARGEIVPYYQPVVRLKDGKISGFEALARWRHPRRGLLTPDEFLPLCEEMGLMTELGAAMMRAAAQQLAEWKMRHARAGALTCSVNLSTGEIDRMDLVEEVAALLEETGLPPLALKLEITESEIMRDPDKASLILRQLRRAGASLSLDDFGTGFSSLSYLTRLPFDTLKIDRYFVRTMGNNEGSAKIVRSVVNLGRELALEVVAEGVENAAMARALQDIGCDYGQGFGYAPALSSQEAEVYLNEAYADGVAPVKARG